MVFKQDSVEENKVEEEPKKTMADYMAEFMVDSGARYIAIGIVLGFFIGALSAGIFIGWLIWG